MIIYIYIYVFFGRGGGGGGHSFYNINLETAIFGRSVKKFTGGFVVVG
jgi:hypothetical protein